MNDIEELQLHGTRELAEEVIKLESENNKLQSNWNSLREFVENDFTYVKYGMKLFDRNVLLDKMNELEGKKK